jgi:hypothetical protein
MASMAAAIRSAFGNSFSVQATNGADFGFRFGIQTPRGKKIMAVHFTHIDHSQKRQRPANVTTG